ncbi:MAG: hypothetical protein LBP39_01840 [Rickettsiales bacterium]|nr:hypothetical protein [Rickettsiales bacterium]
MKINKKVNYSRIAASYLFLGTLVTFISLGARTCLAMGLSADLTTSGETGGNTVGGNTSVYNNGDVFSQGNIQGDNTPVFNGESTPIIINGENGAIYVCYSGPTFCK